MIKNVTEFSKVYKAPPVVSYKVRIGGDVIIFSDYQEAITYYGKYCSSVEGDMSLSEVKETLLVTHTTSKG
jgi:nitrite reductase/ring-hydroxylating ferredoxin subunit